MSDPQIVYIVEAKDFGAVCAFSTHEAARESIDSGDHSFPVSDLSITAMVVEDGAE
ncbi:hypothetical protein F9C11_21540 [Amycolatopsis sp. VS8301801F10]|uniref:hypothetical protein n=1 Tax=Amycolatopsis sp. VS8301801F10 TaxID=2652442 RepID=UPI0038FCF1E9